MLKDKLIVILLYLYSAYCFTNKYCEICANHTLCLFPKSAPSVSCTKYENSTLTKEDIESILNRINSRRNFIALGQSKNLPGAGNMRKIAWSDELAVFAQRWADQCDPSTRPHNEDDCRNLETVEVGQNIASLSGLSAHFNVANFIEIWYMQSLDYRGSVTYYNEYIIRSDNRTRYFTQLIWANTDSVGCGLASFYIEKVRVLRLVCDFAPKGNIQGKPIYLIGYPATQCSEDMVPDDNYKGLCNKVLRNDNKLTSQTPPVSSLLRIINLSNNTDLLQNNKTTSRVKSRKLTTIFLNNTHAAVKRYPQHNFWEKPINQSKPRDHNIHQVENPWRVFHGFDAHNNLNLMNKPIESEPPKFDSIYTLPSFNKHETLKLKQKSSCTRKTVVPFTKDALRGNCDDEKSAQCTRSHRDECRTQPSQNKQATSPFLYSICSCDSYTTTTQRTTEWSSFCQCLKNNPQIICSNFRKAQDEFTSVVNKKSGTFYHYDLSPNLHLRERIGRENVQNKLSTHVPAKESLDLVDMCKIKGNNPFFRQVIKERRKRSETRFTTLMPFWKMDDTLQKKTAVRYTTLPNKKIKHTKMKTGTTSIEPITVMSMTTNFNRELVPITEKYLSFDELMQLRNKGGDARRVGDFITRKTSTDTTTTTTNTKEITTNTPFLRMKHCTRKFTCTWTIPQRTDCNGSVIFENDGNNRGSRTPPGYVDGCTRTSTCTRDYMDRNKLVIGVEDANGVVTTTEEDEDYCERRSLDVRRRNSRGQVNSNNQNIDNLESIDDSFKNKSLTSTILGTEEIKGQKSSNCVCYNLSGRAKRDVSKNRNYPLIYKKLLRKRGERENLYYGELYYKVLRKIRETWEKNKKQNLLGKCVCSGSAVDINPFIMCLMLSRLIIFI